MLEQLSLFSRLIADVRYIKFYAINFLILIYCHLDVAIIFFHSMLIEVFSDDIRKSIFHMCCFSFELGEDRFLNRYGSDCVMKS